MGYYSDKSQIPQGFEEWTFSNMPEDGEIVDVLKYGKIETMRFDKPYMAFNPKFDHYRMGDGWMLGIKHQEGITHFRRRSDNRLKEESKIMCIRDKTKVCDLCHECDISILNPNY